MRIGDPTKLTVQWTTPPARQAVGALPVAETVSDSVQLSTPAEPARPLPATIDMLTRLRNGGRFYTRRFYVFKCDQTPAQVERLIDGGKPVHYTHDGHDMTIQTRDDAAILYQFEAENVKAPREMTAVKMLSRGLRAGDGLRENGRAVSGYEAWQALSKQTSLTLETRGQRQELRSVADAGRAYDAVLRSFPLPFAVNVTRGEPLSYLRADPSLAVSFKAIYNAAFDRPFGWTEACFADSLKQPEKRGVLVSGRDGVVGMYLTGHDRVEKGTVNIDFVSVMPDAQGKHIGERLFVHMLGETRAEGEKRCFLEVDATNTRAQALYQKCGFVKTDDLPDYYWRGRDGWRMVLDDLQSEETGRRLQGLAASLEPMPSAQVETAASNR